MNIRKLELNDFNKDYISLLNQLSPTQFNYHEYENFILNLPNNHHIYVIEFNNKIICTGTLIIENKLIRNIRNVGHIEDIITDINHRNLKLGSEIVNHLTNLAKELNCYKVILNCTKNFIKYYEKNNFEFKNYQMALYF